MADMNRRSLLAGIAAIAVAPALPRSIGRVRGWDFADVNGAGSNTHVGWHSSINCTALEFIPAGALLSQVSYRGRIYVERAVR